MQRPSRRWPGPASADRAAGAARLGRTRRAARSARGGRSASRRPKRPSRPLTTRSLALGQDAAQVGFARLEEHQMQAALAGPAAHLVGRRARSGGSARSPAPAGLMPLRPRPAGSPARPRPERRRRAAAGARSRRAADARAGRGSARRRGAPEQPAEHARRGSGRRRAACRTGASSGRAHRAASRAAIGAAAPARCAVGKPARVRLHRCPSACRRGTPRTPSCTKPVSVRRKRLLYQSRYRGLPGERPAVRRLRRCAIWPSLTPPQLDRYEALLEESDQDLFAWISGQQPVPDAPRSRRVPPAARFRLVERRRLTPPTRPPSASVEAIVAEPALSVLAELPRAGRARRTRRVSASRAWMPCTSPSCAADAAAGADPVRGARRRRARAQLAELVGFFAPELEIAVLPAWDCLPYDRVSPNADIMARAARRARPAARGRARAAAPGASPRSTPWCRRCRRRRRCARGLFAASAGERIDRAQLLACLARNGYRRSGTVVEPGEYAVRGGIIDIFPSGSERPLRLDLFGDELERIRAFDPLTQRSLGEVAEVRAAAGQRGAARRRRRSSASGSATCSSSARRPAIRCSNRYPPAGPSRAWSTGCRCSTSAWSPITDYLEPGAASIGFDHLAEAALESRARDRSASTTRRAGSPPEAARAMGAAPYRPLPPDQLYLERARARAGCSTSASASISSPFARADRHAPPDRRGRRSRRAARARLRGRAGAPGSSTCSMPSASICGPSSRPASAC